MPLTKQQINSFRNVAKGRGFSDQEVEAEIARKQQESDQADVASGKLNPANAGLGLGDSSNNPLTGVAGKVLNFLFPAANRALKANQRGQLDFEDVAKAGAEIGSFAVPFGKGANVISKVVAPGLATGALQGLSQEQVTPVGVAASAGLGAGGAGLLHGFLKTPGLAKKGLTKGSEAADSRATNQLLQSTTGNKQLVAEHLGTTPEQAYTDLFGKETNWDRILGPLAEKNTGGKYQEVLKKAEDQIQATIKGSGNAVIATVDQLKAPLLEQKATLTRGVGNQDKVSALDEVITEIDKRFKKKGATAQQLLDFKRDADTQFGKGVIEDTKGSVTSQSQKMVANVSRGILKDKFSSIADALDVQSKALTLQPILGKARAKGGKPLLSLTDLLTGIGVGGSTGNLGLGAAAIAGKNAMENPNILNLLSGGMKKTAGAIPDLQVTNPVLQQILGLTAAKTGAGALSGPSALQVADPRNEQQTSYDEKNIEHGQTISPTDTNVNTSRLPTENQLKQLLYTDIVTNKGRNKANIKDLYELLYPGQGKEVKKTEKQKLFTTAAQGAQHALDLLESGKVSVGPVKGTIQNLLSGTVGTSPEQQDFTSTVALARSALLNAYLGGNIPPAEFARISAGIPSEKDPTPTAKSKLKTFIREISRFAQGEVANPSVSLLSQ